MLERRELSTRRIKFFHQLAYGLVKVGLTPNMISVVSIGFAALAGYALSQLGTTSGSTFYCFWILSLVGIQFRLLCNMIDGLMAIEGKMKSLTGDIYNDFPDRLSDLFILLGAGFGIPFLWGKDLGWIASILAVMTAYVRLLGTSLGCGQDYKGPLAKQHRMGLLNVSLVALLVERIFFGDTTWSLTVGMVLIVIGTLATVFARLGRMVQKLKANAKT